MVKLNAEVKFINNNVVDKNDGKETDIYVSPFFFREKDGDIDY